MKNVSILLLIANLWAFGSPLSGAAPRPAFSSQLSPPSIVCPSDVAQGTDSGEVSARVSYSVSATNNYVNVDCQPPSDSIFPVGTTVVQCVATDLAGTAATCNFTVTIKDIEPPQLICPPELTFICPPESCSAECNFQVMAEDLLPGLRLFCFPPAGL